MTASRAILGLLIVAVVLPLVGCGADAERRTQPKLASEQECMSSGVFQRCQFQH